MGQWVTRAIGAPGATSFRGSQRIVSAANARRRWADDLDEVELPRAARDALTTPRLDPGNHAALWLSERHDRMTPRNVDVRFAKIRTGAGLDPALTLHSLRHSYVTHLIEFGYAERFVQEQVGHHHSSTTAIYASVSDDYKNRIFQEALTRVLGKGAIA